MSLNPFESYTVHEMGSYVPESYSRKLDERVAFEEMPYGYDTSPPAADTGDYDQAKLNSTKQYPKRHGRAV